MTVRHWLKPKWKHDDLSEKLVEFKLSGPRGWVEGVGQFQIHILDDQIAIDIEVRQPQQPDGAITFNVYHLFTDEIANRIEPHPDQSVAHFRLAA